MAGATDLPRLDLELARHPASDIEKELAQARMQTKRAAKTSMSEIACGKHRRYGGGIRNGLAIFLALVLGTVLIGLSAMVWNALRDHALVVKEFSVPADLAQQGITGRVVAAQVLDQFVEFDKSADPIRAYGSYAHNWNGIKVEIPESGVSLSAVSRLIDKRFAPAIRVDGAIHRTAPGLEFNIRVGAEPLVAQSGTEANLRNLIRDTATEAYARSQPYRYASWLRSQGRLVESDAVLQQLIDQGPPEERVWGLYGLYLNLNSISQRRTLIRQIVELDAKFVLARWATTQLDVLTGHDEAALSGALGVVRDLRENADRRISSHGRDSLINITNIARDEELSDSMSVIENAKRQESLESTNSGRVTMRLIAALQLARQHDLKTMPLDLQASLPDDSLIGILDRQRYETTMAIAMERQDWTAAVALGAQINANYASGFVKDTLPARLDPFLAEAYAHLGRNAEADAVLASIPPDVYDGWRARGRVAMLRRDYAGADRAFAAAVRHGPSIPRAYNDWGDLLAAKGDPDGAIAKYAEANRLGPHFAEPLKGWGDELALQGHWRGALAKYNEALKYAPNWATLKEAQKAAAEQKT